MKITVPTVDFTPFINWDAAHGTGSEEESYRLEVVSKLFNPCLFVSSNSDISVEQSPLRKNKNKKTKSNHFKLEVRISVYSLCSAECIGNITRLNR